MVLSDRDIKKFILEKKIIITPKPDLKTQLGSCSLDLHLGNEFRVFEHSKQAYIDPFDNKYSAEITKLVTANSFEPFILHPQDFVLAVSKESFTLPDNLLARLEGRSSMGRLGIVVHSTASIFEPGWSGKVVMELGNMGRMPVALYPGMLICALTFEMLSSEVDIPYNKKVSAKYQKQNAPLSSKISQEKIPR